eukprot:5449364-Amphidinium_carterae.1
MDILETQLAPIPRWRSVISAWMSTCVSNTAFSWHVWDPDLLQLSAADIPGTLGRLRLRCSRRVDSLIDHGDFRLTCRNPYHMRVLRLDRRKQWEKGGISGSRVGIPPPSQQSDYMSERHDGGMKGSF